MNGIYQWKHVAIVASDDAVEFEALVAEAERRGYFFAPDNSVQASGTRFMALYMVPEESAGLESCAESGVEFRVLTESDAEAFARRVEEAEAEGWAMVRHSMRFTGTDYRVLYVVPAPDDRKPGDIEFIVVNEETPGGFVRRVAEVELAGHVPIAGRHVFTERNAFVAFYWRPRGDLAADGDASEAVRRVVPAPAGLQVWHQDDVGRAYA